MLPAAIFTIVLLIFINYYVGGRAFMYPPVVFCSVWAADLLLVLAAGDFFFPLSGQTLCIFVLGCTALSTGSFVAMLFPPRAAKQELFSNSSSWGLTLLVLLVALCAPLFVRWVLGVASTNSGDTLLMAMRIATLSDPEDLPVGYTLFMNLATLATIAAMISFCEKGRVRTIAAIILAAVLNLLTGAKVGVFMLLGCLLAIDSMKVRRVRWRLVAALSLAFIAVFSIVSIEVHTGGASPEVPFVENVERVAKLLVEYAAGGLVAFDQVVRNPTVVPHNWGIDRFFLQTLNKLGAHYQVPPLHAYYVDLGHSASPGNVYTFYFAYFDCRALGITAILTALGLIVTRFYLLARGGNRVSLLIYSTLFAGLVLSPFNESLFFNLNFLGKLFLVSWLLYRLPAQRGASARDREIRGRALVVSPPVG